MPWTPPQLDPSAHKCKDRHNIKRAVERVPFTLSLSDMLPVDVNIGVKLLA